MSVEVWKCGSVGERQTCIQIYIYIYVLHWLFLDLHHSVVGTFYDLVPDHHLIDWVLVAFVLRHDIHEELLEIPVPRRSQVGVDVKVQ